MACHPNSTQLRYFLEEQRIGRVIFHTTPALGLRNMNAISLLRSSMLVERCREYSSKKINAEITCSSFTGLSRDISLSTGGSPGAQEPAAGGPPEIAGLQFPFSQASAATDVATERHLGSHEFAHPVAGGPVQPTE